MRITRTNSNYFPDDLPHPSTTRPATVETHYLQCGCTVSDTPQESPLPFAFYGDVVSWSPSVSSNSNHSANNSEVGTPPRAASPGLAVAPSDGGVLRLVDPNFCERASCGRSLVFNREWNRLWEAHSTEMKEALDDNAAFEEFKARIRKEAKEVTEGLLGKMPPTTTTA